MNINSTKNQKLTYDEAVEIIKTELTNLERGMLAEFCRENNIQYPTLHAFLYDTLNAYKPQSLIIKCLKALNKGDYRVEKEIVFIPNE